jgi:isoleucyl-tRNA synthetase
MAPFTPFIAEAVYKSLTDNKESVHLEEWPLFGRLTKEESSLIETMALARAAASQALAERNKAGIKVKQPLSSYKTSIKGLSGKEAVLSLVADEANVKEAIYDPSRGSREYWTRR